jgi:CheY-like chemotaxis protein
MSDQGETLLLVDDEPQVREMLQALLECLHYRVLTAANGAEALAIYERYSDTIALVLTDLGMPVMGGIELCRALWQRDPGVKILVMTACPLEKQSQSLPEERLRGWLRKPFALAELAQAIRRGL